MRCGFLVFIVLFISLPVFAQPDATVLFAQDIASDPIYRFMAQEAIELRPRNFDFMNFRGRYSLSSQYDPTGDQIKTALLNLAYAFETETEPEKKIALKQEFESLARQHLAHLDVVNVLFGLSRDNSDLGDPEFYDWLRQGLQVSILESGDGKTLKGAYDAITPGEEAFLLAQLGVDVLQTKGAHAGMVWYNMHDVGDPKTGEIYTVFVDVTRPMQRLERDKADSGGGDLLRRE